LLPNDLIIVRNHEYDEEDEWDIKRALERQGDVHIKVEMQSNLEFQSLTSWNLLGMPCSGLCSPTQSTGPPRLQIDVQEAYEIEFGCCIYDWKADEINFPMALVLGLTKIRIEQNS
jgi:hypothetical protein